MSGSYPIPQKAIGNIISLQGNEWKNVKLP